jgi:hypothetical protein
MSGLRRCAVVLSIFVLSLGTGSCGSDEMKKGVNELCAANSDCADGICHRKTCASPSPGSNGASCSGVGQCKSFACQSGKCVGGSLIGGGTCLYDDECASRQCTDGFCTYEADGGVPDGGVPDSGSPDLTMADLATTEAGGPDQMIPDGPTLDKATPDQQVPDAAVPDLKVPDAAVPDQKVPDMALPDQKVPDMALPDQTVPDLPLPDLGCLGCGISFKCIPNGTVNPADSCYRCDVTKSKTAWTLFDGKGCVFTVSGSSKGHQDGDAVTAKFGWIAGLYIKNSKLYITTHGGATEQTTRVRILDLKTNKVSTLAGMGNSGFAEGAALTTAKFKSPMGIVVDNAGVVYVADTANSRIRGIKNGVVATIAGDGNSGTTNASLLLSNLSTPVGLAIDAAGDLYVTTVNGMNNAEIRKLDMKKQTVSTLYTVSGKYQYFTGIDLDSAGKAYFIHYDIFTAGGRKIRDLNLSTKASTVIAGQQAGCVTGTLAAARFQQPKDLKVTAAGDIYVAGYVCRQVVKISGGQVIAVAGTGKSGSVDGPSATSTMGYATAVAVDPATGKVYLGDSGQYSSWNKIRVYTP